MGSMWDWDTKLNAGSEEGGGNEASAVSGIPCLPLGLPEGDWDGPYSPASLNIVHLRALRGLGTPSPRLVNLVGSPRVYQDMRFFEATRFAPSQWTTEAQSPKNTGPEMAASSPESSPERRRGATPAVWSNFWIR